MFVMYFGWSSFPDQEAVQRVIRHYLADAMLKSEAERRLRLLTWSQAVMLLAPRLMEAETRFKMAQAILEVTGEWEWR